MFSANVETRSAPAVARCSHRSFTFYLGNSLPRLKLVRLPLSAFLFRFFEAGVSGYGRGGGVGRGLGVGANLGVGSGRGVAVAVGDAVALCVALAVGGSRAVAGPRVDWVLPS